MARKIEVPRYNRQGRRAGRGEKIGPAKYFQVRKESSFVQGSKSDTYGIYDVRLKTDREGRKVPRKKASMRGVNAFTVFRKVMGGFTSEKAARTEIKRRIK